MPDRENVIKGLECCVTMPDIYPRCEECPYASAEGTCANMNGLHRDALALLKAQEPREMSDAELMDAIRKAPIIVKPAVDAAPVVHARWIDECCSNCGTYVYHGDADNYCPHCGAKMMEVEHGNRNHP